ncbi:MAG TPA: hypothetical protein VFN48_10480 [Solirubrobacteraceae bacterium]|nr:hypothetical protein [Solirubrobacteraceae bacterium]
MPARRPLRLSAAVAILLGGLLAWAIPALAGPGTRHHGSAPALRTPEDAGQRAGTPAVRRSVPGRSVPGRPAPTAIGRRWTAARRILGPLAADLAAPQVSVGPGGDLLVATGPGNEEAPQQDRAELLSVRPRGLGLVTVTRPLRGIQEVLALGHLGGRAVALEATSPARLACCSEALTQTLGAASVGTRMTLADGLEGATTGALIPIGGGLLAAVDNQAGITVARAVADGRLEAPEALVTGDPTPAALAATPRGDGGALLAWTAPGAGPQTVTGTTTSPGSSGTASGYDQPANRLIEVASVGAQGRPGPGRLAVRRPEGTAVEAIDLAAHGAGATLAWTESPPVPDGAAATVLWTDVEPRGGHDPIHRLSSARESAGGVALAGARDGAQVLAWQACAVAAGTCRVRAVLRRPDGAWSRVRDLGADDPGAFPVVAQSPGGQALVGWIAGGRVRLTTAAPGVMGFAPAHVLSAPGASGLAVGYGVSGVGAAVWVQGTVAQSVMAARLLP